MQPKRLITLLLVVALTVFGVLAVNAAGTPETLEFSVATSESHVEVGDVIDVSVTIDTNSGFRLSEIFIEYGEGLAPVLDSGAPVYEIGDNFATTPVKVYTTYVGAEPNQFYAKLGNFSTVTTATGLLFTIKFEVVAPLTDCEANIVFDHVVTNPDSLNVVCHDANEAEYTAATIDSHNYVEDESLKVEGETCLDPTIHTWVCSHCGDTKTTTSGSGAHDFTAEGSYQGKVVAPQCGSDGYTEDYCAVCDTSIKYDIQIAPGEHVYLPGEPVKPTCTTEGYTVYTCSNDGCGANYVADIAAPTGHKYENDDAVVETDPTCLDAGYTTYNCDICDETHVVIGDAATGHSYDEGVVTEGTCIAEGYITYTCDACGDVKIDNKGLTGHNYDAGVVTEGTCIAEGYITYTCADCGDVKVDNKGLTGHNYAIVADKHVDPTCILEGSDTYACTVCGDSYVVSIDELNHTYVGVETVPTCVDQGYVTYTCSVCKDSYVSDFVESVGHNLDEGTVTTAPTCTTLGVKTYACADCDYTETEVIDELNHSFVAGTPVPATCTTAGYTVYTCETCNDASYKADYVDALGHDYAVDAENSKDATCVEEGCTAYKCTRCDASYIDVIGTANHVYTLTDEVKATCLVEGTKTYTCSCGDSYVDNLGTIGHVYDYENGVVKVEATCTVAGEIVYSCICDENCTATITEVIGVNGHNYVAGKAVAPTCTSAGYTPYTCAGCGTTIHADPVNALDHTYAKVAESSKAPTCTEVGYNTYKCTGCDASYVDDLAMINHVITTKTEKATCQTPGFVISSCDNCDYELKAVNADKLAHTYAKVEDKSKAPTCTELGYTTYACSCGDSYVSDYVAATGHTYTSSIKAAADCTKAGVMLYECDNCDYSYELEIAPKAHTYVKVEEASKAPTHYEHGYTTYKCSVCNATFVTDYVSPVAHSYTETVTAPTCTTIGYTTYTCSCGATRVENLKSATGHDLEAVKTEPTCTAMGYTTYTCKTEGCEYSYVGDYVDAKGHTAEEIPAVEPTYSSEGSTKGSKCTVCSEVLVAPEVIEAKSTLWIWITCSAGVVVIAAIVVLIVLKKKRLWFFA